MVATLWWLLWVSTLWCVVSGGYSGSLLWMFTLGVYSGCRHWVSTLGEGASLWVYSVVASLGGYSVVATPGCGCLDTR